MAGNAEIFIQNLTYFHDPSGPPSLRDVNISLPKGSRTLLIGANGGVHFRLTTIDISVYQTLVFISWEINPASNSSGQATRLIRGSTNPNKRARCLPQFSDGGNVSRHRMGSSFSENDHARDTT